jgi:small subunit ribosomal protein S17
MSEEIMKKPETRRYRKVRTGLVTSDKMDKTVTVSVERLATHRYFHKAIRLQNTVKAHDEKNECRVGDLVQIVETRPLSKQKCWRVQKVIERTSEE